jgi:hypothetical protein
MAVTNTLAYYDTTTITVVKYFIVQVHRLVALAGYNRLGWEWLAVE